MTDGDGGRGGDEARLRAAYDAVPYESVAQHHTHPDLLATLGRLAGLDTPPPDRCRVLEIGCGDGGNLLPLANHWPDSHFVGLDLSPVQIEQGTARSRSLGQALGLPDGLPNLELRAGSLLDEPLGGEPFDYILAHGVFSWVPAAVQEHLLALCGARLSSDGVAVVTYNTYPGWHLRTWVRDLMHHEARGIDDPHEKVQRALAGVKGLAEALGDDPSEHARLLQAARQHLGEIAERAGTVLHEYFEPHNQPCYFRDFVTRAQAHGLQYLDDAEHTLSRLGGLPPAVAERLRPLEDDRLELEQALDFALNRSFRRTLLCRAEARIEPPIPQRTWGLWVASAVQSVAPGRFATAEGRPFAVGHPVAEAVLGVLADAWPRSVAFDALVRQTHARLARASTEGSPASIDASGVDPASVDAPGVDPTMVAEIVGSSFFAGVLDLHAVSQNCGHGRGPRPQVFPRVRWQLAEGLAVTNQRHRVVALDDPLSRLLVPHLDGDHDRAALLNVLESEATSGRLALQAEGVPVDDPVQRRALLTRILDQQLQQLARHALLVPEDPPRPRRSPDVT